MPKKARAKLSPLTVIGELLLLAGLGVFGYIVWQPWYSQNVVGAQQAEAASALSNQWQEAQPAPYTGEVPIAQAGEGRDPFAVVYIPALGENFSAQIAQGTERPFPLDDAATGVGHYKDSAMFGAIGNTGIAAHRNGPVAPFRNVDHLRVGDKVYIETKDGWYTYVFRNQEIVTPDQTAVLDPFPYITDVEATDSLLTFTSCYPKDGWQLRIINYSVFESFQPRSDGPPADLAEVNSNVKAEAKK